MHTTENFRSRTSDTSSNACMRAPVVSMAIGRSSTQELIAEHGAVLVALDLLEKVVGALAARNQQAPEHLEHLLDFLKGFVDLCHHGKEEDVLFPELEQLGVKRDGAPIGVMLMEHEVGRMHVRAMSDGLARLGRGEADAATAIQASAAAYRDLLRADIHKENSVLFPMADRLVRDAVATSIAERFEAIERDRVGEGKHDAYHAMLHHLRDFCGIA